MFNASIGKPFSGFPVPTLHQERIVNQLSRYSIILAASLAANAALAATSTVKAPPLPPGSQKVKVQLGHNPKEVARDVRAHARVKKDKTLDDARTATTTATATVTPTK